MRRRAKKSLGQHFLVDANLQRRLVEELAPRPFDSVLEIGPGHGELTRHLVGRVGRLWLVEKDDALATALAERWGDREGMRILHGDVLDLDPSAVVPGEPYRVLSNLPYNVAVPILFRLLELRPAPLRIVVTVQREMARRLAAFPGSKAFGALTVGVQARAAVRVAFPLGRKAFRPVPDVESLAVVLDPLGERMAHLPEPTLRDLTRAAFSRRRKQLGTILREAPEFRLSQAAIEEVCRLVGVSPRIRPEALEVERFVRLAALLAERAPLSERRS